MAGGKDAGVMQIIAQVSRPFIMPAMQGMKRHKQGALFSGMRRAL